MGSTQSVLRILRLYSGSNFIYLASRLISSYIKALYKFLLKLFASSFLFFFILINIIINSKIEFYFKLNDNEYIHAVKVNTMMSKLAIQLLSRQITLFERKHKNI
jgi:hypothetical protein